MILSEYTGSRMIQVSCILIKRCFWISILGWWLDFSGLAKVVEMIWNSNNWFGIPTATCLCRRTNLRRRFLRSPRRKCPRPPRKSPQKSLRNPKWKRKSRNLARLVAFSMALGINIWYIWQLWLPCLQFACNSLYFHSDKCGVYSLVAMMLLLTNLKFLNFW